MLRCTLYTVENDMYVCCVFVEPIHNDVTSGILREVQYIMCALVCEHGWVCILM